MIRYDLRAETAWITLDRPEKLNALHLDGWQDLIRSLDRAAEEARVAVLAGAGDAFSAGDDIATIAEMDSLDDVEALAERLADCLYGIETLPIPVIAAVDGIAYGGGFELAAAADLAVASDEATFALPETRIGAFPPYVVSRIAETGGRKRLMELVLTGEPIDAATAHSWGLVNRVVPPDELESAVAGLVDDVVRAPESATRLAKRYAAAGLAEAGERERIAGGFSGIAGDEACRSAAREFLEGARR